jgi:L-serine dehydratase
VARVHCGLYGSLGATGKGHGSDKAVLLGLAGLEPDTVDVDQVPTLLLDWRTRQELPLLGAAPALRRGRGPAVLQARDPALPRQRHAADGLRRRGRRAVHRVYYSVGGGFVVSDEVAADGSRQKVIAPDATVLPCPSPPAPSCWRSAAPRA